MSMHVNNLGCVCVLVAEILTRGLYFKHLGESEDENGTKWVNLGDV